MNVDKKMEYEKHKIPFELKLAEINHFNKREWLEMLNIKDGDSVLEIGCGTGAFSLRIKEFYPNCKVLGIDIDENKIEFAKNMAKALKKDVEFKVANLRELPIKDNQYNVVFSHSVIEKLPVGVFLDEQFRVLKGGGKFCAITVEKGKGKRIDFPAVNDREEVLWEKLAKAHKQEDDDYNLHLLDVPKTMLAIKSEGFIKPRVFFKNIMWYNPDDSRFPSRFAKGLIRAKYNSDLEILKYYQQLNKGLTGAEYNELKVLLLKKYEERILKYNTGESCWDLDSVFVRAVYAEKPYKKE